MLGHIEVIEQIDTLHRKIWDFNLCEPIIRLARYLEEERTSTRHKWRSVRVRDWAETHRELRITGQPMTAQEYETLTGAEHCMVLPTPLVPLIDSMVWIFRPNHPRRDAALAEVKSDVFVSSGVFDGPEDSKLILVRGGEDLLDRWSIASRFKAFDHAETGSWDAAELEANLAFATSLTMRSDHLGLMIVIYEHQRRVTRAEGTMTMALRSRGPAFSDAVAAERDRLRARFP